MNVASIPVIATAKARFAVTLKDLFFAYVIQDILVMEPYAQVIIICGIYSLKSTAILNITTE